MLEQNHFFTFRICHKVTMAQRFTKVDAPFVCAETYDLQRTNHTPNSGHKLSALQDKNRKLTQKLKGGNVIKLNEEKRTIAGVDY